MRIAQFPYDQLDDPDAEESAGMTREETEQALKLFRALVGWLWANGSKNRSALITRAVFVSWLFLDEVRAHDLRQIVAQFDHARPDIGRMVKDFKKAFPMVAVPPHV